MSDFNPYAAPKSEIVEQKREGLWRDGLLLVIGKGTELPDRCLRCNEPAHGYRLKRTFSWHKPAWYLLVLFNLIIYIIVAMCVRWTAKVSAPFCPRHRSMRRRAIALGWLGSLAGISLVILGASSPDYAIVIVVGVCLFLGSLIFGVIASQLVVPKKIDENFVWLKKVSPVFLATVPDWR